MERVGTRGVSMAVVRSGSALVHVGRILRMPTQDPHLGAAAQVVPVAVNVQLCAVLGSTLVGFSRSPACEVERRAIRPHKVAFSDSVGETDPASSHASCDHGCGGTLRLDTRVDGYNVPSRTQRLAVGLAGRPVAWRRNSSNTESPRVAGARRTLPSACHSITSEASQAGACERSRSVGAGSVDVAVVSASRALIIIGTSDTIARVAGVACTGE